jgi:hypothetical protein
LARALGRTAIEKDAIKEALFDSLGASGDDWSRRLSDAAFEVMFGLARTPDKVILEGNFRRDHGDRLLSIDPSPIEIFCRCPDDELLRRNRSRGQRHRAHPAISDADLVEMARCGPLALGGRLLEVDTSERGYAARALEWACDCL